MRRYAPAALVVLAGAAVGVHAALPAEAPHPAVNLAAAAPVWPDGDPAYDGRFTFLRIQFETGGRGMRGFGFNSDGEPPWAHDTPRAERHLAKILEEVTSLSPYMDGGKILRFDDPELFRYPLAYIVEVGFWQPTDAEVEGLRNFLLKGGFLIVDDFRGPDITNFQVQMHRVLPGALLMPVEASHDVFDSFFHIADPLSLAPPTYTDYVPVYLGIFEHNDPTHRLMAIVNYNNDLAEYWEFADQGYYPIDLSNEAYKFGVNYVVYAMTH